MQVEDFCCEPESDGWVPGYGPDDEPEQPEWLDAEYVSTDIDLCGQSDDQGITRQGMEHPFPSHLLPPPLGRFIEGTASDLAVAPAAVGVQLLAAMAASVGVSYAIRLNASWVEPSVLIAAVVTDRDDRAETAMDAVAKLMPRDVAELAGSNNTTSGGVTRLTCMVTDRFPMPRSQSESAAVPARVLVATRDHTTGVVARRGHAQQMLLNTFDGHPHVCVVGGRPVSVLPSIASIEDTQRLAERLARHRSPASLIPRTLLVDGLAGECSLPAMSPMSLADVQAATTIFANLDWLYARWCETADGTVEVNLDQAAQRSWEAYLRRPHDAKQVEFDLRKLSVEKYAARLALLVWLARWAAGQTVGNSIDDAAIRSGIELAAWLSEEHDVIAARLHGEGLSQSLKSMVAEIAQLGGSVTVQKWQQKHTRTSAQARSQLSRLVQAGLAYWGRPKPGPKGGRPSLRLILDPR